MQTRSRLFDDLARLAGGAAGTVAGIKEEIEALVRQRVERLTADLDLVNREEFEAARDMAAKARAEQERLEKRVAALEAELGAKAKSGAARKPSARKAATRKSATRKTAARKTAAKARKPAAKK
jgi:BMFP domain-containing protein YqiC